MDVLLVKIATALLLPPGVNIALGVAGLVLMLRLRRVGVLLTLVGLASLYAVSTPIVAGSLIDALESVYAPLADEALPTFQPDAIVVLGGGIYPKAPEYGVDTVAAQTLPRLHYGAYLSRKTGLPLLVTGGRVYGTGAAEGTLMKEVLERELTVGVRWVEDAARNTAENARNSKSILAAQGLNKIILVTDAYHMARAVEAFERVGFIVLPAPVQFSRPMLAFPGTPLPWLPSAAAFGASFTALHEYLGRGWYRLRY